MAIIFVTKGKTNWKYLAIVFVLGLIVGAATLWLTSKQEAVPIKFPEIKKPETVVKDETANWKTYESPKVGFSIKCPPELKVELDLPGEYFQVSYKTRIYSPAKGMMLEIEKIDPTGIDPEKREQFSSLQSFINREKSYFVSEPMEESIIVDRIPGTKLSLSNEYGLAFSILLKKEQKYYKIGGIIWAETQTLYLPIFNQMLSTFRFLPPK